MKMAVIGANGKSGRLIAWEAYKRGHEVTAIVRDAEKIPGCRYHLLEKDLFDLTEEDLRGFDVVISTFGLPFGGNHPEDAYRRAYAHLIGIFEKIPEVRLLVVGGAGSLYTDETRTARVLDSMPVRLRKDPSDLFGAYQLLGKSSVNYTFFAPALSFDPYGGKTGSYRLGSDYVIRNGVGDSYISYGDYALAMVDEAERGNCIRGRLTAVAERKTRKEKPWLGIRPEKPEFEGLSQYREPLNFELAGRSFRLAMDDGSSYAVSFLDGHTLRWGELGTEQTVELEPVHAAEIQEYLTLLDLTQNVDIVTMPGGEKLPRTVIAQPGLRYAQAKALIESLLLDPAFSDLSITERNSVQERILSEIMGRMMEDAVLLETKLAMPKKQVFVMQFAVGEFDMVVFDPATSTCEIYEIKHSAEIVPEQIRHLIDEEKCRMTEHRFGTITGKYVIYRGLAETVDDVQYLNVEEYLCAI